MRYLASLVILLLPSIAAAEPTEPAEIQLDEPAPPPAVPSVRAKWIEPYGAIAGGLNYESVHATGNDGAQHPTVAISRMGVRGGVGEHVTFASSFEASMGGAMGYGASVWEGQAALAIRDQYLRYRRGGATFAVGRMDDPASIDFVSKHMGDLLYADGYSRDPLLYSGADRGNGIFGTYDVTDWLTAGLTFHSTNPTGITGTLVVGGKLSVFDRPFYLASAQVGRSSDNTPDQNLHIYFGTPSLRIHTDHFQANLAVQLYSLDTQVATSDDQTVRGYNLRASVRGDFPVAMGTVQPFANASSNRNEILDPIDSKYRLPDLYRSYEVSTGVDWDFAKRGGIGFEYAMIDSKDPDQHTRLHYLNLGSTWWIEPSVAIGVRAAVVARQVGGEMETTGSRSLFVTARLVLE